MGALSLPTAAQVIGAIHQNGFANGDSLTCEDVGKTFNSHDSALAGQPFGVSYPDPGDPNGILPNTSGGSPGPWSGSFTLIALGGGMIAGKLEGLPDHISPPNEPYTFEFLAPYSATE